MSGSHCRRGRVDQGHKWVPDKTVQWLIHVHWYCKHIYKSSVGGALNYYVRSFINEAFDTVCYCTHVVLENSCEMGLSLDTRTVEVRFMRRIKSVIIWVQKLWSHQSVIHLHLTHIPFNINEKTDAGLDSFRLISIQTLWLVTLQQHIWPLYL